MQSDLLLKRTNPGSFSFKGMLWVCFELLSKVETKLDVSNGSSQSAVFFLGRLDGIQNSEYPLKTKGPRIRAFQK